MPSCHKVPRPVTDLGGWLLGPIYFMHHVLLPFSFFFFAHMTDDVICMCARVYLVTAARLI